MSQTIHNEENQNGRLKVGSVGCYLVILLTSEANILGQCHHHNINLTINNYYENPEPEMSVSEDQATIYYMYLLVQIVFEVFAKFENITK